MVLFINKKNWIIKFFIRYFSGNRNSSSNKDINECEEKTSICQENSSCFNIFATYECPCNDGYILIDNICTDFDECSSDDTDRCPENSQCENTIGSFNCNCDLGFTKNLTTEQCDDFDECAEADDLCGDFETCVNNIGSGVGTATRSPKNFALRFG